LGLEEFINFRLDEERDYRIRGYIDRLALVDDSVLEIHDYKTSSRLPTQEDVDTDRQLSFYQMGVEGKWKDIREIRLIWHYLAFDAEIRSLRTPEQLHVIRQQTLDLIQRIETDTELLPKEGPLCAWCDYPALCPKRKHLVALESLPPNEYLNEEGVALVNRYVELREKKRVLGEEIDAELSKIEEALYAYGRREKVEAIFGGDHVARIHREMKEKYPLKGDPRRRTVDDLIKRAGKWMEVSDLNPWMLARILARNNWDPLLVKKLKEFCISEETRTINVSKLKERE